ncbi:MAG: serine protein kinase PrkA [Polyangiaceae bacterium]
MGEKTDPIKAEVSRIAASVEQSFRAGRRVLSFAEYLALFEDDPVRYARDASRYVRDMLDAFGTTKVSRPWGDFTRWNLFDLPFDDAGPVEPGRLPKGALVGQEHVQEEIYRVLSNFAREARPNRLILLHGPNGSAKSTIVGCLMAGLEAYSQRDEGALYRFNWVFPSTKTTRGSLGFGSKTGEPASPEVASFAHLADDQIDAKLLVEVRDHPLFLVPVAERRKLVEAAIARYKKGKGAKDAKVVEPVADWLVRGQLSHKSQQVFEALLSSYRGSYADVLKHVQVERYFVSRRYRTAAVTIGPQMSVDAGERQITADRSLSALPASLQALTLYEARGELVDAAGGILEFSDLLKRPLDTFKYLQLSVETGEVALNQQNVQLNCVMMGSANELHLDAFREHPEFASFRGRLELVRAPYLLSHVEEQSIYDSHVVPQLQKHAAPHATEMAAMFAVLTRMRKPNPDKYSRALGSVVASLTALEKMDLYAFGRAPERLDADVQKLLSANVREVWKESEAYPIYEGRIGASPREMRVVLFDAAQSTRFDYLSPIAVLDEIDALCVRRNEFEWLQEEPVSGGYHDHKMFRESLLDRLLTTWESTMYTASGLVAEDRYSELFDRYVQHVSSWTKRERLFNRVTGQYEEPDEKMMREIERLFEVPGDPEDWRRQIISTIAAWALDHPGQKVEPMTIFPHHRRRMREAIFAERRGQVARITKDIVILLREDGVGLDSERRSEAKAAIDRLTSSLGYTESSAVDMASMLVRRRFAELVA